MKRYFILISITLLTICGIMISGSIVGAAVEAKVYSVKKTSCENIVTASGKLQFRNEVKISSKKYCMTDHIFVSDGDKVSKGDPLLTVYEAENISDITASFPDAEKYIQLLTSSEIAEDIVREIKNYTVRRTICSPSDGVVTGIAYSKNCFVNKNNVIMKIADTNDICVKASVSETNIEKIREGQRVRIKFAALSGKQFHGTIDSIAQQAKQSGGLTGKDTVVEVIIKPDNSSDGLRIGYSAECEIITSIDEDVLMLPYEYVLSDEGGEYVFVSRSDRARKIYVKTGKEYKDGIEIKKGLKENDLIIRSAADVTDGQKLELDRGEKK